MKHKGTQTLDNDICQMICGAISLSEGNAKETELHLLSAENITEVMETKTIMPKPFICTRITCIPDGRNRNRFLHIKINILNVPSKTDAKLYDYES